LHIHIPAHPPTLTNLSAPMLGPVLVYAVGARITYMIPGGH